MLAVRLLRRQNSALLRTSALASLVAVALGSAALVVTLALMTGYRQALRDGVLSAMGHVVAVFPDAANGAGISAAADRVRRVDGVVSVGEAVYLPGLLFSKIAAGGEPVTLRAGVPVARWGDCPPAVPGKPLPALVGVGLARRLALAPGSVALLQVMSGGQPRSLSLVVARVISTGVSEIDERWAAVDLASLRARLAVLPAGALEVMVANPERAQDVAPLVGAACGSRAIVTTWIEVNPTLVGALRWQKLSLALVLSLVLGVGAFEVASALVVLFTEKRREFGILFAIGGSPELVRRTLLLAGAMLGGGGVVAGILLGLAIAGVMTALHLPHFSPEVAAVYMVDRIPLRVLPLDVLAVAGLGLIEVVIASLLPARSAARREPIEAMRWT